MAAITVILTTSLVSVHTDTVTSFHTPEAALATALPAVSHMPLAPAGAYPHSKAKSDDDNSHDNGKWSKDDHHDVHKGEHHNDNKFAIAFGTIGKRRPTTRR